MEDLEAFALETRMFVESARAFPYDLPNETQNEWLNGLTHLIKIFFEPEAESGRSIRKATGHVRRAHLDYLKVYIFRMYRRLQDVNPEACQEFMRDMSRARLSEFSSVGGSHEKTFDEFRTLIRKYYGAAHASGPENDEPLPFGEQDREIGFSRRVLELYMEWARLEVLFTSIKNERYYKHLYRMFKSYLDGSWERELPCQIAQLKYSVVHAVIEHCNKSTCLQKDRKFPSGLFNKEEKEAWVRCCSYDGQIFAAAEQCCDIRGELEAALEKPFAAVVKFLDISLPPLEFMAGQFFANKG